jgi:hypothetical protein
VTSEGVARATGMLALADARRVGGDRPRALGCCSTPFNTCPVLEGPGVSANQQPGCLSDLSGRELFIKSTLYK